MKRQGQIVAATINNFEAVEEALINMQNSAGSAEKELAIYQESAAYAMNELKETFTALAQNVVSRGELKALINTGTFFLELINGIVGQLGLIPSILTTIVGIISAKKFTKGGIFGFNEFGDVTAFGTKVGKNWWSNLWGSIKENNAQMAQFRAQITEINNAKNAIDAYSTAYVKGKAATEQFNEMATHTSPIVRECAQEISRGANAAEACSKATARLSEKYQQVSEEAKTAGTNINGLGSKLKNLLVGIGNMVSSMLITAAISAVIGAVIQGINSAINYTNDLKDKLSDLADEYESIKSEISNINEELVTTNEKIAELEALPKLSILQEEELEELKKYNDELERQRKLREAQEAANRAEARKTAKETDKQLKDNFDWKDWVGIEAILNSANNIVSGNAGWQDWVTAIVPGLGSIINGISDISDYVNGNNLSAQLENMQKYADTLKEIEELEASDAFKKGDKNADNKYKELNSTLDELTIKMASAYEDWETIYKALHDSNVKSEQKTAEYYKNLMDQWDILSGKIATTTKEIFDNPTYSYVIHQLIEMAEAGELTAEKFQELTDKDINGIEDFKRALENVKDTDIDGFIESVISRMKELKKDTDGSTNSVKTFAESLDSLSDSLDDIISKQEKLADTFKRISSNAKLTAEEIYDILKEIPELYKYIEYSNGGYTISPDGITEMNQKFVSEMRDKIQSDANKAQKNRDDLNLLYEKAQNITNGLFEYEDIEEYQKLYRQLRDVLSAYGVTSNLDLLSDGMLTTASKKEIKDAIGALQEELDGYVFLSEVVGEVFDERAIALDGIKEGFSKAKSQISDYNNDIKTIDSVIKTLKEDALLTYEEMNDILEIAPELHNKFVEDKNKKGYYITISALEDLKNKSYETRDNYINDRITETQANIESAKEQKAILEEKAGYFDKYVDFTAQILSGFESQLEAQEQIDIVNAQIKEWEKNLERFEGLKNQLYTNDDNSASKVAEQLQNEIDYYKNILEAVEIMRDRYNEAVDKEIDALEEVKTSLEETNDERQRELDLIEARNNLENAKKRKVWVYSESGGFQQVRDEKALKEAEEKYRDVVTEIQEAEIDKQIKALEEQKKQLEQSLKDLTDFEKNLEEAAKLEQAKSALGLVNDKDLLNLSDAIREGIKNGFADAYVTQFNEENADKTDRNGNSLYTDVTLDDVLKSLGTNFTSEDIKAISSSLPTIAEYVAAKSVADDIRNDTENAISSIINNTGNTINVTYNITDTSNPEAIANEIDRHLVNLFTKIDNSIK